MIKLNDIEWIEKYYGIDLGYLAYKIQNEF